MVQTGTIPDVAKENPKLNNPIIFVVNTKSIDMNAQKNKDYSIEGGSH